MNLSPMLTSGIFFFIIDEMSREALGSYELMVLLAVLRVGRDAYGVTVAHELEQTGGRHVLIGSVYAALDRLEKKGLIVSSIGEPTAERGGRAKKYFKVTAKGVRETREACRTFTRLLRGVPTLEGELA
jgi:PadR family transcriptional regulator, regulatory protein PadR